MKNKLNVKLILSLMSFIASIILILCGKYNNICMGFACFCLALCFGFVCWYILDRQQRLMRELQEDLEQNPATEVEEIDINHNIKSLKFKDTRMIILLVICTISFIIAGITLLI